LAREVNLYAERRMSIELASFWFMTVLLIIYLPLPITFPERMDYSLEQLSGTMWICRAQVSNHYFGDALLRIPPCQKGGCHYDG
jgi:hypothetical protein